MSHPARKIKYKKLAMAFSLCAFLLWGILGTGASLAWFTDTSETVTNIFHFADFELAVSHRTASGAWEPIDGKTDVFDNTALYEPGYVQIVYLKVENKGSVAFDFYTAVNVTGFTTATNVFGSRFLLQDHLRFGVAVAASEAEAEALVATREAARQLADRKLANYSSTVAPLAPGETAYLAIVVCMSETVGNEANYRGETIPQVELGIIVKADQQR